MRYIQTYLLIIQHHGSNAVMWYQRLEYFAWVLNHNKCKIHIRKGKTCSCAELIITAHSGNLLIALNSIAGFIHTWQIKNSLCSQTVMQLLLLLLLYVCNQIMHRMSPWLCWILVVKVKFNGCLILQRKKQTN